MKARFEPSGALRGELTPPADKSISHRAALLGAMAAEPVRVRNFLDAADTNATLAAVQTLGALVEVRPDELVIRGTGLREAREPSGPIDVGNAGTLMRLLPGWLAAQEGRRFTLDGDDSIRRRPVDRIAEPLGRMGATLEASEGRYPPFTVRGERLRAITYELPVASAQVKSCVLLAGLYADGETTVVEPAPTRDHTERMLAAAGAPVTIRPTSVTVSRPERLSLGQLEVPGDFSSAAPFLVAATLVPGSELHVHGVNLNPRRTGLLAILERMGARITVYNRREVGGEPAGDLEVHAAPLVGVAVGRDEVPVAIDELPLFALAAACARGESVLRGAEELRAKESDRIDATVDALRALGVRARGTDDGLRVTGVPTRPRGGRIASRGDHRLAMLGAVAGLASREGVRIDDAAVVAVSFPGFFEMLDELRRASAVREDDRR